MVAGWVEIGGEMAVTDASYFSTSEMLVASRSSISSLDTALVEKGVSSADLRPSAPLLTLSPSFFFSTVALTSTVDSASPISSAMAEMWRAHRPAAARASCRRDGAKGFFEDMKSLRKLDR